MECVSRLYVYMFVLSVAASKCFVFFVSTCGTTFDKKTHTHTHTLFLHMCGVQTLMDPHLLRDADLLTNPGLLRDREALTGA